MGKYTSVILAHRQGRPRTSKPIGYFPRCAPPGVSAPKMAPSSWSQPNSQAVTGEPELAGSKMRPARSGTRERHQSPRPADRRSKGLVPLFRTSKAKAKDPPGPEKYCAWSAAGYSPDCHVTNTAEEAGARLKCATIAPPAPASPAHAISPATVRQCLTTCTSIAQRCVCWTRKRFSLSRQSALPPPDASPRQQIDVRPPTAKFSESLCPQSVPDEFGCVGTRTAPATQWWLSLGRNLVENGLRRPQLSLGYLVFWRSPERSLGCQCQRPSKPRIRNLCHLPGPTSQ